MARVNSFQDMARAASERIDQVRAEGRQLELLPPLDEGEAVPVEGQRGRGRGKATSQLRDYLAHRGWRFPEEQLARIAGLDVADDLAQNGVTEEEAAEIGGALYRREDRHAGVGEEAPGEVANGRTRGPSRLRVRPQWDAKAHCRVQPAHWTDSAIHQFIEQWNEHEAHPFRWTFKGYPLQKGKAA